MREARYKPGDRVWVGQSRSSMREALVLHPLGSGSYKVDVIGRGTTIVDEALLSHREVSSTGPVRFAADLAPTPGMPFTPGTKLDGLEEVVGARRGRMRWYNPSLRGFEWREVPGSDEEALSLLDGYSGAEGHAAAYREWRSLGSSILAALIRAGEAAKEQAVSGISPPPGLPVEGSRSWADSPVGASRGPRPE